MRDPACAAPRQGAAGRHDFANRPSLQHAPRCAQVGSLSGGTPRAWVRRVRAYEEIRVGEQSETELWRSASWASRWFADASREAHIGPDVDARRREIVFAVCFVESYLFEWTRALVKPRAVFFIFPRKTGKASASDGSGFWLNSTETRRSLQNPILVGVIGPIFHRRPPAACLGELARAVLEVERYGWDGEVPRLADA